ncbi:unnamed protein product [Didymodactylos carnosus]|uniref:Uncharacterized protein n=1 Tax=Didymodactylos carnosus TaxID=1234261 RepID=A0A815FGM2_9BILA|nr:unnamed protein product [Didymodactylos carnosus]CAF1325003.1 unnamed protein product [Didymodactylos carnosus]CAF3749267.1 unnamed protein product [Didymodactylos carnosus]CAF4174030.1 unnamed protein product [Didymodactylos carnosus]
MLKNNTLLSLSLTMQPFRTRAATVRRNVKHNQEIHLITNPQDRIEHLSHYPQSHLHHGMSQYLLHSNSKWKIVRENIHRIHWLPVIKTADPYQECYIFFQMRRELKRLEPQIKNVACLPYFKPVRHFRLAIDETHQQVHDTSQVKPNEVLHYSIIGKEPIVLQYMLYYFSQRPVPYNSVFHPFLCNVTSVIKTNRRRLKHKQILNNFVLLGSIIVYISIGFMFLVLLINVLSTISKLSTLSNLYGENFYSDF